MNKNNCLNCKHEPDWSKPSGGKYVRRTGKCKWDEPLQILPVVYYKPNAKSIVRYSDDSGIFSDRVCRTWEPKP